MVPRRGLALALIFKSRSYLSAMNRPKNRPSRRHLSGRGSWLARYRYAVAAIDQIGLSLFNFALNFCLLRALSATEFGIVSLWMAVAMLAIGVQGALVSMPLSVHVPAAADPVSADRLEEAVATVNLIVVVLAGVLVAVLTGVSEAEWAAGTPLLGVAITLFVVAGLYREYYRARAFGRRDMALLLVVDLPYLAVTTTAVAAMLAWPERFAGLTEAFLAISLGGAVSQVCVRFLLTGRARRVFRPGWTESYRAIAGEVMWSLLGAFSTDVQSRSYVYITTSLVGLAGLGALNAVGVLFRPVRILMSSWGKSALPHLASLFAGRQIAAFDRAVILALAVGAAGSAAVFGMLWLGWHPIEHYLLADKYPAAGMLLLPWALASGLNVIDYILGIALQAAREFKFLAQIAMLGAPITAIATIAAVLWHGYTWTMYGVAFGNGAIVVMQMAGLQLARRRMTGAVPPAGVTGPQAIAEGGDL